VERRATPRLKTRVREVLCCLEGQKGGGRNREGEGRGFAIPQRRECK